MAIATNAAAIIARSTSTSVLVPPEPEQLPLGSDGKVLVDACVGSNVVASVPEGSMEVAAVVPDVSVDSVIWVEVSEVVSPMVVSVEVSADVAVVAVVCAVLFVGLGVGLMDSAPRTNPGTS